LGNLATVVALTKKPFASISGGSSLIGSDKGLKKKIKRQFSRAASYYLSDYTLIALKYL